MKDRRKTGVQRVVVKDGNGGKLDVYTMTLGRLKVWLGVLAALVAILSSVFAAVRVGVGFEVHTEIDRQTLEEDGVIHRKIEECAQQYIGEMKTTMDVEMEIFEERLDTVELLVGELKGGQKTIASQQERNQQELKMLLERAIANGSGGSS